MEHRNGGKISGRHTTIIEAAVKLVDELRKDSDVKKISLGFIKSGLSGHRTSLKISKITGGLKLVVKGNTSKQELYVYTGVPNTVEKRFQNFFK